MVTHQDTTLTDDNSTDKINSGTAIALQGTSIKYRVGVFLQVGATPGKETNQAFNTLLDYGDFLGFENPIITITGVMNLNAYDTTTGAAPSNVMTVKLLQEIYQSGHEFLLSDVWDSSTTTPIYRIHGLAGTFPSNTITTLRVMCSGVSIESSTQTKEGTKLVYTMTLKEVRS